VPRFDKASISWLSCALLLLCGTRAQAAPEPIIFDFEDGLQGWELHGSAQRVQTQILGGEWAIFGDVLLEDGGWISNVINLTDIVSVSLESLFLSGDPGALDLSGVSIGGGIAHFFSVPFDLSDPALNPAVRTADLRRGRRDPLEGGYSVFVGWGHLSCGIFAPCEATGSTEFIDNITFHPIPEPGHLGLLGLLGVLGLRSLQRRSCGSIRPF
jgi:hypothetical protein